MAATVEIVIGPARVGKTTTLVGRLREHVEVKRRDAVHASGILWIAPTSRAAEDIRDCILGGTLTACLGTSVLTFDQFADGIVRASGEEIRPISRVSQRILLRRLILDATTGGRLRHFDAIAETEGFLGLLLDFIRDMKQREIWPDEFDATTGHKNQLARNRDRNRELADLYRRYQDILNEHRLYDAEGRFWAARALLREDQRRPYAATTLVIVDGFTDFTRTQHEILALLAGWVEHIVVSLPMDHETNAPRTDLFSKSTATLDELKQRHADIVVTPLSRQETVWPTLEYIEENLFRPPGRMTTGDRGQETGDRDNERESLFNRNAIGVLADHGPVQRIRVLGGASDMGEIETIAGEIKHLLTTHAACPGDVLVVARSLDTLAPLVQEVFNEFGIPFSMETRRSIGTTSLVRGLLSLLQLDCDDWPFRAVLSVITSWNADLLGRAVVGDDTALEDSAIPTTVAAERVVRNLQVDHGRKRLLDRVRSLASSQHKPAGEETYKPDPLHQNAQAALPLLERLAALLDELPTRATPTEWVDALATLAGQLGFALETGLGANTPSVDRDSSAAWQRLASGLAGAERLACWLGEKPPKLDRTAIMSLLRDIATHEKLPAEYIDTGCVRVLSAPSARALRAPYMFIIGMGEGSFPQVHGDNRLFSDAECAAMSTAGLPIETRRERYEDEMLLFYEVLTRAERQVTLSYPGLDERASPLLPSPFLQELLRLGGDRIERIDCLELGPVNRRTSPRSPSEFRIRAVADALGGEEQGGVARLAQLLAHGQQRVAGSRRSVAPNATLAAAGIDAGLKIIAERGHADCFGPAEGVMAGKRTRFALAEQFGEGHLWSTSQFEAYAACPFRFLMEKILRLKPLDDLTLETDYLRRGGMVHASLAKFHERLKELASELPTTSAWNDDEFLGQYGKILEALIEATPLWGVDAALRELDQRQALDWAAGYFQQHEEYDQHSADLDAPFMPSHFEVRFGPARHHDDGPEDGMSTDAPFELDLGDGIVRITGRIDRIDLGKAAGQVVFNIIDYKTGAAKAVTDEDIERGLRLQGPLYAMAAEQLLLKDQDALAWQADYWWLRKEGFGKKIGRAKDVPKAFQLHTIEGDTIELTERWKEVRGRVLDRVRQIISGIRGGQFPMVNADEHCTKNCPFRTACRVAHVRALEKPWPTEQ